MSNGRRVNAPHVVLGLFVMALGVVLVLDRLGIERAEELLVFWPVGLILLGVAMMLQALGGPAPGGAQPGFPLGAVIWIVVLGLVFSHVFERRPAASDGTQVNVFSVMGGNRRQVVTDRFRGATITTLAGGTRLDLSEAVMAPGEEAVLDMFTLMGGAVVTVPTHWQVQIDAVSVLGSTVDVRGRPDDEEDRARRRRSRGRPGVPPVPAPAPQDSAEAPKDSSQAAEPTGEAAGDAEPPPVERPDEAGGPPPRLIVRGFVMMGGVRFEAPEAPEAAGEDARQ